MEETPALPKHVGSVREAQGWTGRVVSHSVRTERVALDASSDRLWLRLECTLDEPIPDALLAHSEFVCFSCPIGGLWKRQKLLHGNRTIVCSAHKRFQEPSGSSAGASSNGLASFTSASASSQSTSPPGSARLYPQEPPQLKDPAAAALFGWEMQLGTRESAPHWFAMDVRQMARPPQSRPCISMKLLAGFAPVELRFTVHGITAVEIAAQSFTADVTWELTVPAIAMTLEEHVYRELLELLDFNQDAIELVNAADVHSEKPVAVTPSRAADYVYDFADPSGLIRRRRARVFDVKYSRRVVATFNEEMTMYYFPFDQQKLSFTLDLGRAWHPFVRVVPAPVDAASFAFQHFKLSNVFDVVFGDKVFVGNVTNDGATKSVRFELMLERRSGYYLANIVIPAAILTYMSFISYAPLSNGDLMDTSSRLQIVTTLLLTCVTFKYNIASLIPQVSYFTWLGKYLFCCFMVMCVVVWENALFPLVVKNIRSWPSRWHEGYFLWLSLGAFTFGNLVWGVWVWWFVRLRASHARVLVLVHEHLRVIAPWRIPLARKHEALMAYLEALRVRKRLLPDINCSDGSDLFVVLPSDSPTEEQKLAKARDTASGVLRKHAIDSTDAIQDYFRGFFAGDFVDVPAPSPTATTPTSDTSIYSRIGSLTDEV